MKRRTFLISAISAAAAMLPLPSLAVPTHQRITAKLIYPGMLSDSSPGVMNWQCSLAYWREKVVPYIEDGWELAYLEVLDDG